MLGVYYQTFMLSPPSYRRIASWTCGWLYVVGNVTITLAVNFGTTLFLVACINVFESAPGVGIWDASAWEIFLVFVAITFLCNAISSLGNRWLPIIDVRVSFASFGPDILTPFRLPPSSGPLQASWPSL